jgi:hypothetical protein
MTSFAAHQSIHLCLHCIVPGLLVDFMMILIASIMLFLMGQEIINLHLHALKLVARHVLSIDVSFQSSLGAGLFNAIFSKSFLCLVVIPVLWKLKPRKELGPSLDLELEFKPHVRGQSYKIIQVVRSKDSSDLAVSAKRQALYLVASLNEVACR